MKFIVACKKFFGTRQGQTLKSFLDEVKKLTIEDRREMKPALEKTLDCTIEDVGDAK